MTILNMTYGAGNPYQPFHLNAISNLAVTGGNNEATITWTDPGNLVVDGQTLATWVSTKLVRKIGSAPTTSSDGTLVVTETVADTYSSNGYTDTGLTNGTTYYYAAFAVASDGLETISNTSSIVTGIVRPTITGFSYDNKTGAVAQSTYGDVNAITFKPDGTKLYIAGEVNNTVYQFSLATPRDISTISYDNKSKSVSTQVSNVTSSIIFTDDGLTMFIGGRWDTGYLYKYTLSTAWDVSTANYDNIQSNKSFRWFTSCKIYNNGNYVYSILRQDDPNKVMRYTLSTPRDITTMQDDPQEITLDSKCQAHEVILNPSGTQMFVLARKNHRVFIYSLATAWDLTTATKTSTYTIPTPSSEDITSMTMGNDGANMYLGGYNLNNIYQYSTTTS